jgi:hypothetical protein
MCLRACVRWLLFVRLRASCVSYFEFAVCDRPCEHVRLHGFIVVVVVVVVLCVCVCVCVCVVLPCVLCVYRMSYLVSCLGQAPFWVYTSVTFSVGFRSDVHFCISS